jgi:hypothetical protein
VISSTETFKISASEDLIVACEEGSARSSSVTPEREKEEEKHP